MSAGNDLKLAKTSGFPLQLAIESLVNAGTAEHGWKVSTHEHPWKTSSASGFADVVIENGKQDIVRMVVECKRRYDQLLFFCPSEVDEISRCRVRWGYRTRNKQYKGGWVDVATTPKSFESEFCVVSGEGAGKKRAMLESIAHDLVESADSICVDELALVEDNMFGSALVYIPLLVTTARLAVCRFDPSKVDMDKGHVGDDARFTDVDVVRFRKALAAEATGAGSSLTQLRRANERTVTVVSAKYLESYLREWSINRLGHGELPWKSVEKSIRSKEREKAMERELNG